MRRMKMMEKRGHEDRRGRGVKMEGGRGVEIEEGAEWRTKM